MTDLLDSASSFKAELERIRAEARDEQEKGRWFENLVKRLLLHPDAYGIEFDAVWRWSEWPELEIRTGRKVRKDLGIDLVGRLPSGGYVAIQCKCYMDDHRLTKTQINSFLSESQRTKPDSKEPVFEVAWLFHTCKLSREAELACDNLATPIKLVPFAQFSHLEVGDEKVERPVQMPRGKQVEAIDKVTKGLTNADRGMMVMACGTGKTFVSLRISENIVPEGGKVLFAAPSIALVNQSRREWLRHTTRPLHALVVCSDTSAGGRNDEDIRVSEMVATVTTKPDEIKEFLYSSGTGVIFSTYQSLDKVLAAQEGNELAFDLAIADEAHRTTGYRSVDKNDRKVDFQAFHDRLNASRRLYMTATPRIYTESSKARMRDKGADVFDMEDDGHYGNILYQLNFDTAVKEEMLSDYRVIILGVNESWVGEDMKARLNEQRPTDAIRAQGVLMAVSGGTQGKHEDGTPVGVLPRTLAFASSISRSDWFANTALDDTAMRGQVTRRLESEGFHGHKALTLKTTHVDGKDSAYTRSREISLLRDATERNPRLLSNCKLFTEGVDVPSLNAVAFLDHRDSDVDIVQAVGRVMRKAEGKRFGYVIVPIVLQSDGDIANAIADSETDFKMVGKVMRALAAHDPRITTEMQERVIFDPPHTPIPPPLQMAARMGVKGGLILAMSLAFMHTLPSALACATRAWMWLRGLRRPASGQVWLFSMKHYRKNWRRLWTCHFVRMMLPIRKSAPPLLWC
ncbi:MAG: DEAD/DEAH box helicase family protein [Gammaproteobacteria bacterium]|nr:DEAD/DEAH box helicase family protein [Gammaproteobacteria bacterium]